jgi:hypothetical protein
VNQREIKASVTLTFREEIPRDFFLLLQEGVLFRAETGAKVKPLLTGLLQVTEDYVDERINTVFLNGKAVDELEDATVGPDAIIAVSASMPGFVGACFRKSGYYASMRSNVAYRESGSGEAGLQTFVCVKLFNVLARELGEPILKSGIVLPGADFRSFFSKRDDDFWAGLVAAAADGMEMDINSLRAGRWPVHDDLIELRVGTTTG